MNNNDFPKAYDKTQCNKPFSFLLGNQKRNHVIRSPFIRSPLVQSVPFQAEILIFNFETNSIKRLINKIITSKNSICVECNGNICTVVRSVRVYALRPTFLIIKELDQCCSCSDMNRDQFPQFSGRYSISCKVLALSGKYRCHIFINAKIMNANLHSA